MSASNLSCTTGVAERYVENIRLKGELNESRSDLANRERRLEVLQSQVDGIDGATTQTRIKTCLKKYWKQAVILAMCLALAVLTTIVAVLGTSNMSGGSSPISTAQLNRLKAMELLSGSDNSNLGLDIVLKKDRQLRNCKDGRWKKSFPDLDYAMLGYDLVRGYPLATGHDPGFTHPIFTADYSTKQQTTDCRYSVPKGLVVVPDVSCVTSFASKLVRSKVEMSETLEAAANVGGGGWGFKFSASGSYKRSVAEMSSGESLYIISQAQCQYYYSTIDYTSPPPFHAGFLFWVRKLAAPDVTKADIIKFIKYYGTHFLTEVTFGAKFIKKHKLSQKAYQSMKNEKLSVEVQASYSGAFSVQGGFAMSKDTLQAVSKFQQSVETSTITVGAAPPSNGEAMTWAASVKDNPVPTLYTLSEIHNLFSGQFIKGLPANVNLTVVRERLRTVGKDYCKELMYEGQVDSCEDDIHLGKTFPDVSVHGSGYKVLRDVDDETCSSLCLQEERCVAVEFHRFFWHWCKFFDTAIPWSLASRKNGKVTVFLSRLQREKKEFVLSKAKVDKGTPRDTSLSVEKEEECKNACARDSVCDAFVMCNRTPNSWCKTTTNNCFLYSQRGMTQIVPNDYSETHFVWKNYTLVAN